MVLLARTLSLAAGTAGGADVCSTVLGVGCDATLAHPLSKLGGIPLAGWGVVYFATTLLLLALGRWVPDAARATHAAAAATVLAGSAASVALLVLLLGGSVALCPLCLVVNGANLAVLWPLLRWRGTGLSDLRAAWGDGARYLVGRSGVDAARGSTATLSLALAGLFAVTLYQWVLIEHDRATALGREVSPAAVLAAFEAAPVVDLEVSAEDPSIGPVDAPAQLVIFSDAFCPHCRALWSGLPDVTSPYRDDLRIVFKHFPLDTPCNSAATTALHPYACIAGIALEAAHRQGRFWAYHDALTMPDLRSEENFVEKTARDAGLDVERFDTDMQDATLKERMERDIALGQKLGITATPTLFLDGRRLEDIRPEALRVLLDHVLRSGASR